eukprot:jgi/Psemu1/53326/gm1.53326_g
MSTSAEDFGIVYIFEKMSYMETGTIYRNALLMVSHFGFLTFNFINAMFLLIGEGYVTGKLRTNRAAQFSLAAHVTQLASCATSIHRYNISDEFGVWARIGTISGTVAVVLMTTVYLHLLHFNNAKRIKKSAAIVGAVAAGVIYVSYKNWKEDNFKTFRFFTLAFISFYIYPMWKARKALKNGEFTLDEKFVSADTMVRAWDALIFLTLLPVFTYPMTGLVYSICMINAVCMGRMSFMQDGNDSGSGSGSDVEERSSGSPSEKSPLVPATGV